MSQDPTSPPEGMVQLGGLPPVSDYVKSVWGRREFAVNLAAGQLRAQNFDTLLGNLWHLLNPLLLVGVYYLMFGVILDFSRGTPNFVGFLAVGIFVYTFLQKSIISGATSIVGNVGLIRSLQFPRAILPVSNVLKEVMAFGSTVVVMMLTIILTEIQACSGSDTPSICSAFQIPISITWLVFIPIFALMLLFVQGAAFMTARLTDHIRDTTNLLPYIFRIGFYLSGVLYSVDRFVQEEWVKQLFIANPFFAYITLVRHYLMPTYVGSDVNELWISGALWAVGAFIGGLLFFRAREKRYGRG